MGLFFSLALVLFLTPLWMTSILIFTGFVFWYLNRRVLEITNKSTCFSAQREIKQYTTLVIGDYCSPNILSPYIENNDEAIFIMAPDRSMEASYRILLHTVSILEGEKTCIIVDGRPKRANSYTIFDLPYFNLVTKKELGIEKWDIKSRFPLFFEFYKSIRVLFKIYEKHYVEATLPDRKTSSFCSRKGIKLITLTRV